MYRQLKGTTSNHKVLSQIIILFPGKFANDLRTFEVIIPAKVDDDGDIISHHLHHKAMRRWKRDADNAETLNYHLQVSAFDLLVYVMKRL